MPRLRKHYDKDYTVIPNNVIRDTRLSFKARGIFLYLWHLKEDYDISLADIQRHSDEDGQGAVRSGVAELETCGYLHFERVRIQGKFVDTEWTITDRPSLENPKTAITTLEDHNTLKYSEDPSTEKEESTQDLFANECFCHERKSVSNEAIQFLTKILSDLSPLSTGTAATFHHSLAHEITINGGSVIAEHPVKDRGDGKPGRIDLLMTAPWIVGIELDAMTPRIKSYYKLRQIEGIRVVICRSPGARIIPPEGIHAVLRFPHPHECAIPKSPTPQALEILSHLSTKTGRDFRVCTQIEKLLATGVSVEDCKLVIDFGVTVFQQERPEWYAQYFDNVTPFRPENFDKYHARAVQWRQGNPPSSSKPRTRVVL